MADIWGVLRTIGLWALILGAASSATIDFIAGNSIWAWFKILMSAVVIAFELYYYFKNGRTISTKYKEFIVKHPVAGKLSLFLFGFALSGLILHLAVWGGMMKKEGDNGTR